MCPANSETMALSGPSTTTNKAPSILKKKKPSITTSRRTRYYRAVLPKFNVMDYGRNVIRFSRSPGCCGSALKMARQPWGYPYLSRSCMSGPGYRMCTVDAWPGDENVLRQSTRSPRLRPKRTRPSAAYSYSTNSCDGTIE
jgi:hypothetical protein